MEERTNAQLDRRLLELRTAIREKRGNIRDLEDTERLRRIPLWFYVLVGVHYILMLEGWRLPNNNLFVMNCIVFFWLQMRLFRSIRVRWAVTASLTVLVVSALY